MTNTAFLRWVAELSTPKMTTSAIVKKLGISRQFFSNMRHGRYKPGAELALRIAKASGGKVPVTSWEDK